MHCSSPPLEVYSSCKRPIRLFASAAMSNSFKDLVIRDATMEDCSAINQLHSAVSYEGVLTWGSVKTESQTREWLGLLLRLAYPCLVALSASGEIVACGALTPGWDPRKDAGSIHSVKLHIVVAQVHRNYGLATRLFGLLQQHHKSGARQIYRVVCRYSPVAHWSMLISR